MQIGKHVANKDVLNLSVSGASVEDIIAIWQIASSSLKPSTVFIGADPWLFNRNSGLNRWTTLSSEYAAALSDLGIDKASDFPGQARTFPFNQFLVDLYNSLNTSSIKAFDDSPSMLDKIRRDGSRVYNLSYASKSEGEIERGAPSYLTYAMTNYIYSDDARNKLEKFIKSLSAKYSVVLILSPYHPTLYKIMMDSDQKFLNIEAEFKKISEDSGVKVIGSYDPTAVGCIANEFFDGMHPKDSCLRKVLSVLHN